MSTYIDRAEGALYKTYSRFPVVFERGEGVRLYDDKGTEYLDFGAGIAVMGLGYHYPGVDEAAKSQIDKLVHTSNLFYNIPATEAAEKLLKVSEMDRVFFTNSGTEAIEGALKIAKRHAYNRGLPNDYEIIAMEHSFHGRSLGALSVTGNAHYREPFDPLIPNIKFAEYNNLDSVKALWSGKTAAVIMETIQGEGGIYPATEEFLNGVRALCDETGALLILDEIQCGMGRSGNMFAWQAYGVKPDVMTVAKALGNGFPIGAFLAQGEAANAMTVGDHGSTYGGNPLVCAVASKVLDIYKEKDIPGHVRVVGEYLWNKLEELMNSSDKIVAHRGRGLIQGLEFNTPVADIVKSALMDEHLVLISAGKNVIRFVPPLIITEADVDEMVEKLLKVLA
ncbi:MAG: aspartate aminotransferase family protein [Oscillospiraceae bacterium]|nr:aspartate aminotransferase family protein [Oscillospiraceae bacterium]